MSDKIYSLLVTVITLCGTFFFALVEYSHAYFRCGDVL